MGVRAHRSHGLVPGTWMCTLFGGGLPGNVPEFIDFPIII